MPLAGNYGTSCTIGFISGSRESNATEIDLQQSDITEESLFNLNVFPNPFTNKTNFIIQSQTNDKVQVQIFDMVGNIVLNQQVNTNTNIPVGDDFAKGTYLIKALNTKGEQAIFRLVKVD